MSLDVRTIVSAVAVACTGGVFSAQVVAPDRFVVEERYHGRLVFTQGRFGSEAAGEARITELVDAFPAIYGDPQRTLTVADRRLP